MGNKKVIVYTSPTCGACNMVKSQIPGSKYESLFEIKTIYGAEGHENLEFIKSKGFSSIPVIQVVGETAEEFHVGFVPMNKLNEIIERV